MRQRNERTVPDEGASVMGWWTEHVVPRIANHSLGTDEVHRHRARVCQHLRGDVVEVGFGSGLNAPHYPAAVSSVAAVEPSDLAWQLAQPRIAAANAPVVRVGTDGQRLDLADSSVDTALSTFTMCTIPDLDRALGELARVLRPGGRLHFVEHGRSDDPDVARWQDRLEPLNRRICGGCHLNRPIARRIEGSALQIEHLDTFYERGPRPFGFLYLGSARSPA